MQGYSATGFWNELPGLIKPRCCFSNELQEVEEARKRGEKAFQASFGDDDEKDNKTTSILIWLTLAEFQGH